jgi:regulatory protein
MISLTSEHCDKIKARALYLLSMREHGDLELTNKLTQKFSHLLEQFSSYELENCIENVLIDCQTNNWQSNTRFIESYVRQAMQKGQGAFKIRNSLQAKTHNNELIKQHLNFDDEIWIEIARKVLLKKYGETTRSGSMKEQNKRLRFLQSRGFAPSQIYKSFEV